MASPILADDALSAIRQAVTERGASWQADDNPAWQRYFDGEESCLFGLETPDVEPGEWYLPPVGRDLPAHFDWRDYQGENWVTAVKDQALCAGCSAFGATASLETRAMWALQTPEPPLDLSEQHLFSCSGGDCQSGANMSFAMIYLRQHGTPDEACFPYQAQNGDNIPCDQTCADWESRAYRIRSWNYVFHLGDFDRIKEALLEGPLYTYILIYEDFFAYAGGVYEHVWGNPAGGHGVSIIGWDDAEECWIGKNSWTDGWGEGGFFRIRWGEAEIETYMGRMVFDPADAPDDDDDDTSPADDDDDDDNDDDNDSDGDDDDNDGQDDDDDDNHDNAGCN